MDMLRINKRGQTLLEYAVLLIIVMGALLAISNYFKRGLQGRWKSAVDDLGDQYDPRTAASSVEHILVSTTQTEIATAGNAETGFWTTRTDTATSAEQKIGNIQIGSY